MLHLRKPFLLVFLAVFYLLAQMACTFVAGQ